MTDEDVYAAMQKWSVEQQIGYFKGCIVSQTMFLGMKLHSSEIQEAEKIRHYAEKLIEVLRKKDEGQW
jgi:hypothetical protein